MCVCLAHPTINHQITYTQDFVETSLCLWQHPVTSDVQGRFCLPLLFWKAPGVKDFIDLVACLSGRLFRSIPVASFCT